jgi:dTDP-4-amino-4,6-dideoxygalactose transaminase
VRARRREVITTANSGGYSSTAAYSAGLIPVYADITEETQLLSISSAIDCLSRDSLAVVATHLYGGVVDVRALRSALDEAGRSDVIIIEDCAQSHGARLDGRLAGSLGDVSTFSFYPTKNLGAAGDAGAVATSSDELAGIVRELHQYGWNSKYCVQRPGGRNSRMDEVQAAILSALLPHLNDANRERAEIAARYEAVANPSVHFVRRHAGAVVHLAVALTARRDELRAFLTGRGIATDVHYPVLDCAQDGWQRREYRVTPGGLPVSMLGAKQVLSLPCFVGMTASEVDHVVLALSEFPHQ